jgi:surface protein
MFNWTNFNGDISKWNVSNVNKMSDMFRKSKFNGDISNWDVSKVKDMSNMFEESEFNKDLSNWKTNNLIHSNNMFVKCNAINPYWFIMKIEDRDEREKAIKEYHIQKSHKELTEELSSNHQTSSKKLKI